MDEVEDVHEAENEEEVVVLGGHGLRCGARGRGFVGSGFCCGHGGEDTGHVLGLQVGGGWLGGPGRDLAAWRADLVGSGGGGRCGAAVFSFWAWLGRVLQCVRLCGLASAGGNSSRGLRWGVGGGQLGFSEPVGVCGLSSVGTGEGCPADWSVAGVCCCLGGRGRPVSRGPGMRAIVGVCGSPEGQKGGRGIGGDCAGGGVVSVYVSARIGALAWSAVSRAVRRRSLLSSAAAARISQTSLRIPCTSWSVVGRGYASSGLRPTRRRTLWVAWYPQVRECCRLEGGSFCVSGPASICVWAVGMAQIQGTVPVDGQRCWIHWARQSMASPGW